MRFGVIAVGISILLACDRPRDASDTAHPANRSADHDAATAQPAIEPPVRWQLIEEWRIGGEERGPQSFDANLGLALLPSGELLHLDYQASELHVLDTLGRSVRSFGRKGGGPGEIAGANGFVVAPDGRIVVNDINSSRLVVFSPAGAFERNVRIPAPRGTGGRWNAIMLRDGRLLETVVPHVYERTRRDDGPVTLLWKADFSRADTLRAGRCASGRGDPKTGTTIALRKPDGSVVHEMLIPFTTPDTPVAYDPAGARWEALVPSSNEIVRRSLDDCAITARIRLAGARAPMSRWQRDIILQRVRDDARRWKAVPPIVDDLPRELPWFRSLNVDSEGRVWIERALSDGSLAIDVFSPSGAPLARIAGDLPQVPVIAGDRVYGLVRDSLDVSYLVARRVDPH